MKAPAHQHDLVTLYDDISVALTERGWWAGTGLVSPELCLALAAEAHTRDAADLLSRAGVGRGADHVLAASVRRDRTAWLDRSTPAQQNYMTSLVELRIALNRRLFLGLFEAESHFAVYPPGGFYRRHIDSFRGAANRVLSLVLYLNENWGSEDGGLLRIYGPDSDVAPSEIRPEIGTTAIFLSEEIPHEVTTTNRPRASIATWFRVNASIADEIDPPLAPATLGSRDL